MPVKQYVKQSLCVKAVLFSFMLFAADSTYAIEHLSGSEKWSSEPQFVQLNVDDGLPSFETYMTFRDSHDQVWICTDNGILLINGNQKKVFDTKNGLASEIILGGGEEINTGKIWFFTLTNEFFYYSLEDELLHFDSSMNIVKQILGKRLIYSIEFLDDNLLVNCLSGYIRLKKENGKWSMDEYYYATRNTAKLRKFKNGQIGLASLISGKNQPLEYQVAVEDTFYHNQLTASGSSHLPQKVVQHNGENFVFFGYKGYKLNNGVLEPYIDIPNHVTLAVSISEKGELFIGLVGNGVRYYPDYRDTSVYYHWLPNKYVSWIHTDRFHTTWINTLQDGLFILQHSHILDIYKGDQWISSLLEFDNQIYLGTKQGHLLVTKRHKGGNYTTHVVRQVNSPINKLEIFNQDVVFRTTTGDFTSLFDDRRYNHPELIYYRTLEKKVLVKGMNSWLAKIMIKNNGLVYDTLLNNWDRFRISKHKFFDQDRGYFGGYSGLMYVDGKEVKKVLNPEGKEDIDVRDMLILGDTMMVGTRGYGILLCKEGKIIKAMNSRTGYDFDQINTLLKRISGDIWVGTRSGIKIVHYPGFEQENDPGNSFPLTSNIPVDELLEFKGDVLALSAGNLIAFPKIPVQTRDIRQRIEITEIHIDGEEFLPTEINVLNSEQNSIRFICNVTPFTGYLHGEFKYRLVSAGKNVTWVHSFSNEIQFQSLDAGDYSLELSYLNEFGRWSQPTQMLSFSIVPPIWERGWFYVFLFLISGALVFAIVNFLQRKTSQVNKLQKKLIGIQHRSLSSQLNPHFIYNSLNSIGHYVLNNDKMNTFQYMAKFSKLMREIFDRSSENLTYLEEELELAQQYMELEQLRIGNKLEFHIEMEKGMNISEYRIPPVTLQPFLENAIWHGIMPRESGGKVWLRIRKVEKQVICEIEDNGVGLNTENMSRNNGKSEKQGSTNLIRERLSLINRLYENKFKIDISEVNAEAICKGTKVSITVPKLN